jgi:methylmalonyl-CoA/ethylmalonyl-CoA epimerase
MPRVRGLVTQFSINCLAPERHRCDLDAHAATRRPARATAAMIVDRLGHGIGLLHIGLRPSVSSGRMLSCIDHVGVAVESIDGALALYRDALGMPLVHRETVIEQGVDAALLDVGEGHVELLEPLGPETAVGKFLARKGPGLHHVAYRVASVQETLDACRAAGLRLIDETPRTGIRGSQVAFLHPASTGGVLTEIVQPSVEEEH